MLEGRKLIVTGGAGGIGAATVAVARIRGAQVHVFGRTPPEYADDSFTSVDITDFAAVERAVAIAAERMSGIDGLANIAGLGGGRPLADTDMEQWNQVYAVNVIGTLNVGRATLPFLREAEQASIVNVASGVALHAAAASGAYAAAKKAVLSLTHTWAIELAPRIRVNAVCPGPVDTPMLAARNRAKPDNPITGDRYALKRLARPEEIATTIAFLLGSDASYVTGAILPVDGGRAYH